MTAEGTPPARSGRGLAAHVRAGSRLGRAKITPPANSHLSVRPDELEHRLRQRLDALGPAPRAELLHVLMLPEFERADRIGEFWSYPESRTFAELLIDCEEDRTLRAVIVGDAAGGRAIGALGQSSKIHASGS